MKKPKVLVTMREIKRYRITKDVLEKRLKGTESAVLLIIHYIRILNGSRKK